MINDYLDEEEIFAKDKKIKLVTQVAWNEEILSIFSTSISDLVHSIALLSRRIDIPDVILNDVL